MRLAVELADSPLDRQRSRRSIMSALWMPVRGLSAKRRASRSAKVRAALFSSLSRSRSESFLGPIFGQVALQGIAQRKRPTCGKGIPSGIPIQQVTQLNVADHFDAGFDSVCFRRAHAGAHDTSHAHLPAPLQRPAKLDTAGCWTSRPRAAMVSAGGLQ